MSTSKILNVWIFQTGEPLHIDNKNVRPMRAMNLSNALISAGHKVVLWSSAFFHQEKRHRSCKMLNVKMSENLEIRVIPSMGYKRNIGLGRLVDHAQLSINLKNTLKKTNDLPDVGFVGYPPIETAAVLVSWLIKRGIPTLLDVKDQWPSIFLDAIPDVLRPLGYICLKPYFGFARQTMRNATGLSAMADSFLDWALMVANRKKTDTDGVFPLTSPSDQVSEEELALARQWWDERGIINDGRPRLLFVGSHSPAFDFRPVLEAARSMKNATSYCQFVICGAGETSSDIKSMMNGLPNVYFPGWVDRPKIEALGERCLAAIAPYRNTKDFQISIPNKVIDALSIGLPVLSSLRGEVASLISENNVGMSYGEDIGVTLHDCIQTLVRDDALQKMMSQKAKKLYSERFSFDMVYGGLVRHLEKLAYKSFE